MLTNAFLPEKNGIISQPNSDFFIILGDVFFGLIPCLCPYYHNTILSCDDIFIADTENIALQRYDLIWPVLIIHTEISIRKCEPNIIFPSSFSIQNTPKKKIRLHLRPTVCQSNKVGWIGGDFFDFTR